MKSLGVKSGEIELTPSTRNSDILVLKFILVLVFISFICNHFYFYNIIVLTDTIILVSIYFLLLNR